MRDLFSVADNCMKATQKTTQIMSDQSTEILHCFPMKCRENGNIFIRLAVDRPSIMISSYKQRSA